LEMPVGQLQDRYWFLKNLKRHHERLDNIKAETDSSAPKLPVDPRNDKRKVGAALQRVQKINNDNARLLVRLSKVFAHGGNLKPADLGKDPKLEHQRKALRNNASKVIKKRAELNRITFDNKLLLNRILDVPSVINFKDEHYISTNRRHKQLREETTYYRQKHSPFPIAGGAESTSPKPLTSRPNTSIGSRPSTALSKELRRTVTRPESAPSVGLGELPEETSHTGKHHLSRLRAEHLSTVLSMKRPPELVKRVFSALMILVSPFEPSHFDVSWFAVQQWIQELGSVETFLENLRAFEISMVPQSNLSRTLAFMRQSGIERDRLEQLSESLADLCDWVWATCAPAAAAEEGANAEEQLEGFENTSVSPTASPSKEREHSPNS